MKHFFSVADHLFKASLRVVNLLPKHDLPEEVHDAILELAKKVEAYEEQRLQRTRMVVEVLIPAAGLRDPECTPTVITHYSPEGGEKAPARAAPEKRRRPTKSGR